MWGSGASHQTRRQGKGFFTWRSEMKSLTKLAIGALMLGGGTIAAAAPANAEVGVSVGIGGPGYSGYYSSGPAYYGYDYYRPCSFYRYNDLPAPARCYNYFYGYYGPGVFFDSDFVFRDHDDFYRWRDRDDFRHWRAPDWRAGWDGNNGLDGDNGWHGNNGWH